MVPSPDAVPRRVDRRTALRTIAAGATAITGGCVREVRSVVNRDGPDQLSLTISTVPADNDRVAVQIATSLADNLEAVGIDATVEAIDIEELQRRVLINNSFELYVARHPGGVDPDFLYEALHSVFVDEPGWQNPFGFTNLTFDELLAQQRRRFGDRREEAVADLLRGLVREQPFVPICAPDDVRLVRTDRFGGWDADLFDHRLGYVGLDDETDEDEPELDLVVTDARVTENLNPLAVEYRNRGVFVELLYDSLGTYDGDGIRPWLADEWTFDGREATVRLRPGLQWHDGEPLTATDVAFTYRFIDDTSLEEGEVPAPAPRYRGPASLVDEITIEGKRTVRIALAGSTDVSPQAFTVPILPKHVWEERTGAADLPGVNAPDGTTEAIVTDNLDPVGSGPYAFVTREEREHVVFERFEDHFTRRAGVDLPAATADRLAVHVAPRIASAIQLVETGDADAIVSAIEPDHLDDLPEIDGTDYLRTRSKTFYHVGFNVRNAPLSNPYFRRAVARLVDKGWIVEETFGGHATPMATPLPAAWTPPDLSWEGWDPEVPFFGNEGELQEDAARAAFEDAGFRYDDDGRLVVGES